MCQGASDHRAVARIDWAVLCDLAFFDRQDRLSIMESIRTLSAPTLPMTSIRPCWWLGSPTSNPWMKWRCPWGW